jgi:hypothetical protein
MKRTTYLRRIDQPKNSTAGWQVTYKGTKYFGDRKYGGKKRAKDAAEQYLYRLRLQETRPEHWRFRASKGVRGPVIEIPKRGAPQVYAYYHRANGRVGRVYAGTVDTVSRTSLNWAMQLARNLREHELQQEYERRTIEVRTKELKK